MIWEQDVAVIVMLTKLTERKVQRASVYWPSPVGEQIHFGGTSVRLLQERTIGSVTVRIFLISDGTSERAVSHLHFTGWPDFGVPDTPAAIAELVFMADYFQTTLGMLLS
jgi:protein tyrosine phosphatase